MRKTIILSLLTAMTLISASCAGDRQASRQRTTYCNPIDLDYTYAVFDAAKNISYRSGADPAVVKFKDAYYMFVTRSMGYWRSTDLVDWEFIEPQSYWYPQGCNAPAAHNYKDSVLYVTGDPSGAMSVMYSEDPASGKWKSEPAILYDLQDPDLFIDDDGTAYMFWGSSNVFPIRGRKLSREDRFLPDGDIVPLFNTDSTMHGWERFGENHCDRIIGAFIEGPWLTKHDGRYYMQYGAPGTEFNVYGDGVYIADSPLGPYTYQAHNPVSYKPGGFMNGAGHGSTVEGPHGVSWHFASMSMSAVMNWERRICMFPTFFDDDGIMYCDNSYGDYPHYAPEVKGRKGEFTGWMLLSYGMPVTASSTAEGHANRAEGFDDANRPETSKDFSPANMTDENCKTYWMAKTNGDKEWFIVDLQEECDINALQINYFDHESGLYGRVEDCHQDYTIEVSGDGNSWKTIADRRNAGIDAPNAYIELSKPVAARYVRYSNVFITEKNLAICGFRIFGKGRGEAPAAVTGLKCTPGYAGKEAKLTWNEVPGCQGYNVRWGIAPDKMYSSWLVYGKNSLDLNCLNAGQDYWVSIEAFNRNGISPVSRPQKVE